MRSVSLKPVKAPDRSLIYRHQYADAIEVPPSGSESDRRRSAMMRDFCDHPELWRMPQVPGLFDEMSMKWVDGFWTIEIRRRVQ